MAQGTRPPRCSMPRREGQDNRICVGGTVFARLRPRLELFNNTALASSPANPFISSENFGGTAYMLRGSIVAIVVATFSLTSAHAIAQEFNLVIRNHKFEPQEIRVPAGKRVSIYVTNEDASAEEFESPSLKVEKVIPGKSKGVVRIGPLAPGRYEFFGDFHADTAKGVVIAE